MNFCTVVADNNAQNVKLSSPTKSTYVLDYRSDTELGGIAQMWYIVELSLAMINLVTKKNNHCPLIIVCEN
jgi:hypothetical protein